MQEHAVKEVAHVPAVAEVLAPGAVELVEVLLCGDLTLRVDDIYFVIRVEQDIDHLSLG